MAEPLSRAVVFGAKLAALLLFGGLFVVGSHLGLLPLAALTLIGAMQTGSFILAALAFLAASVAASLFAAFGILAIHGLLVLLGSRHRLLVFSGAIRTILIAGLVFALPLVSRLPAAAGAFEAHAWWLPWAPPAWFAGLERWLLGDATRAALAAQAVLGTAGRGRDHRGRLRPALPAFRSRDVPIVGLRRRRASCGRRSTAPIGARRCAARCSASSR